MGAKKIAENNLEYVWDTDIPTPHDLEQIHLSKAYLELRAKNEALADALNRYSRHLGSCSFYKRQPFSAKARKEWVRCTCGLDQALQDNK